MEEKHTNTAKLVQFQNELYCRMHCNACAVVGNGCDDKIQQFRHRFRSVHAFKTTIRMYRHTDRKKTHTTNNNE